jgi:hypothetical protein
MGEKRSRVLDPIERVSEVIFGLLMAMTFIGSLSVATAGREEVRTMMITALGCNSPQPTVRAARRLAARRPDLLHLMDDGVLPTTVDYNGPSGVTFVRQWLARASLPFGSGWALQGSVEEPQADLTAGGSFIVVQSHARRPDLAARVRYEAISGHVQLAGLSRSIDVTTQSPLGTRERHVNGTCVSLSGSLNLARDDTPGPRPLGPAHRPNLAVYAGLRTDEHLVEVVGIDAVVRVSVQHHPPHATGTG